MSAPGSHSALVTPFDTGVPGGGAGVTHTHTHTHTHNGSIWLKTRSISTKPGPKPFQHREDHFLTHSNPVPRLAFKKKEIMACLIS